MKTEVQYRYQLQIKFNTHVSVKIFAKWDISEPFVSLQQCKRFGQELIDDTVQKMHIYDSVTNKIIHEFR